MKFKFIYGVVISAKEFCEKYYVKTLDEDELEEWRYTTEELYGFVVSHIPHDQAEKFSVAVGIAICESTDDTYGLCNLKQPTFSSWNESNHSAEYNELYKMVPDHTKDFFQNPTVLMVQNGCSCCT